MSWDFETDEEYASQLAWVDGFVTEFAEPLDYVIPDPMDFDNPSRQALIPPLQDVVKERGFWACHLGPELGGKGFGQVKLALLNEILGRSRCAPAVFGCQAPDSGNAEIIARFGSSELKAKYLAPLLNGQIASCFSMTEPGGGADPTMFVTRAEQDGDMWRIEGEKWFSSGADRAAFLIVMAVTDPENPPHERASMFIVPAETPGIEIIRNVGLAGSSQGDHSYIRYTDVRVPLDHMLGERGGAFRVAQSRLGGGRIHHAMRTVGVAQRAFEMLCERALSRQTQGERLSKKQLVQEMIAESWLELEQFRLLVLRTAWKIDRYDDYQRVRGDISAVKILLPRVLEHIASRALQVHGSLGVSNEMPFIGMITTAYSLGLADGPTEVHKVTLASQALRKHTPTEDLFPTRHIPRLRADAYRRLAPLLAERGIQLELG
jgi:acyl-CoA dehydrogenase